MTGTGRVAQPAPLRDLRIAVVSHAHPSVSKGGGEIAAYTLYTGLRALGVPAIFVAAIPEDDLARAELYTDAEYLIAHDPARFDHHLLLGRPSLAQELLALLREKNVSLVNFHHYLGFGLGALRVVKAELPVVLTLHEYLAICANHGQMVTRPARQLCEAATAAGCAGCFPEEGAVAMETRRSLFREVLGALDGFIAPSRFLMQRYVDWGLPASRFKMIENGLRGYEGGTGRPVVEPAPNAPRRMVFAYFGQINPFKGVDLLLDAADLLAKDPAVADQFELRIHGNLIGVPPSFEARLDAALQEHPFLRLCGPYDNARVTQLMGEADFMLVPSRWWENSPVVIQEAYAAGRPVICADIGGMAEKVLDGISGLHFRAGDAQDLAATLKRAMAGELKSPALPPPLTATEMAEAYLQAFAAV